MAAGGCVDFDFDAYMEEYCTDMETAVKDARIYVDEMDNLIEVVSTICHDMFLRNKAVEQIINTPGGERDAVDQLERVQGIIERYKDYITKGDWPLC